MTLFICLRVFLFSVFQIEVQSIKVDCKVISRFAHTVMTTKALNKANASQEVSFEVELPKTSFITNFSMSVLFHRIEFKIRGTPFQKWLQHVVTHFGIFREIDGKTYTGVVKEKEKARQQYQKAVSSGQTAGLVKWEEENKKSSEL